MKTNHQTMYQVVTNADFDDNRFQRESSLQCECFDLQ